MIMGFSTVRDHRCARACRAIMPAGADLGRILPADWRGGPCVRSGAPAGLSPPIRKRRLLLQAGEKIAGGTRVGWPRPPAVRPKALVEELRRPVAKNRLGVAMPRPGQGVTALVAHRSKWAQIVASDAAAISARVSSASANSADVATDASAVTASGVG